MIVAAFLYWIVPDLLVTIGKVSFQTLSQLKWVLLGLVLVGGIYAIVRAVLTYKTKIAIIEQQSDIQRKPGPAGHRGPSGRPAAGRQAYRQLKW